MIKVVKHVLLLCPVLTGLASCAGFDVDNVCVNAGNVSIQPQHNTTQLPQLAYYVYDSSGQLPVLQQNSDGQGNFSGTMTPGTYHAVAVNASESSVLFEHLDDYEKALVRAKQGTTANQLIPPGDVLVVRIWPFLLTRDVSLTFTPIPSQLNKTIYLRLLPDANLQSQLNAATATLQGVQGAIKLSDFYPADLQTDYTTPLSFVLNPATNVWQAQTSIFGIIDPEGGKTYTNKLTTVLTIAGAAQTLDIDLTDCFSNIHLLDGEVLHDTVISIELASSGAGVVYKVLPHERMADIDADE